MKPFSSYFGEFPTRGGRSKGEIIEKHDFEVGKVEVGDNVLEAYVLGEGHEISGDEIGEKHDVAGKEYRENIGVGIEVDVDELVALGGAIVNGHNLLIQLELPALASAQE